MDVVGSSLLRAVGVHRVHETIEGVVLVLGYVPVVVGQAAQPRGVIPGLSGNDVRAVAVGSVTIAIVSQC